MAVQDKDNAQQTTGQMGQAFAQAQANQTQVPPAGSNMNTAQSSGFSFRRMGELTRTAMARTPTSEVLTKLTKAMTDLLSERTDKSFEITLIPIDMYQTNVLNISALVLTMRDTLNPKLGVAYHTFLLEASAEAPAPKFENIGGQNIEVIKTPGESWDDTMASYVADTVQRQFPQVQKFLNAGAEVVSRLFNLEDHQALFNLTTNGAFACSQELETSSPDFRDLNLAQAENDSTLQVRHSFGNPQVSDASGNPIRVDVQVDFSAAPMNQQQQQNERVAKLANVGGFLDLVYAPAQPQANQFANAWAPQQVNFQTYMMRFVITHLQSDTLLTLSSQMLALVSAMSLREQNAWVRAFANKAYSADVNMHDIGAVGIESNLERDPSGVGAKINTQVETFREEHLVKLLAATVQPGLLVSMDIPECGDSSWYLDVWAAAAEGKPSAIKAICAAADCLTNGNFSRHFAPNTPICVDENNRIQLGHYVDQSGVRRDLRDIDYLAVANLIGVKDAGVIRTWSDSFVNTARPLIARLADRKRIMTGMFSNVTINGYARRVTFSHEFISALQAGVADCRIGIRQVSGFAELAGYERAGGSYLQSNLLGSDASGIFNRPGFGAAGGYSGYGRGAGTSRW